MAVVKYDSDTTVQIDGTLNVNGSGTLPSASVSNAQITTNAAIARSKLAQDSLSKYPIPPTSWRVHNAFQTVLPGTSAADDLGLYGNTYATTHPTVQTYDVKAAGAVTLYARTVVQIPQEYVEAEAARVRFHAGMLTTVADTTATIDLTVYEMDGDTGISSDLVITAAQSINSLTFADKDFVLTATNLDPGDLLDMRVEIAVNDGGTGTSVFAGFGAAWLLCDVKG